MTRTVAQKYLSLAQAGDVLSVSEATLRRCIRSGDLKAYRVSTTRLLRVRVADLDQLLRPVRKRS